MDEPPFTFINEAELAAIASSAASISSNSVANYAGYSINSDVITNIFLSIDEFNRTSASNATNRTSSNGHRASPSIGATQATGDTHDSSSTPTKQLVNVLQQNVSFLWIIFGTIGNLLSLFVLLRHKMRVHSTFTYLTVLSVCDTLVLYFGLLRDYLLNKHQVDVDGYFMCKFHVFSFYFMLHMASWLLVAVNVDRLIAASFLSLSKQWCTPRTAIKVSIWLAIFLALLNSHFIYFVDSSSSVNNMNMPPSASSSSLSSPPHPQTSIRSEPLPFFPSAPPPPPVPPSPPSSATAPASSSSSGSANASNMLLLEHVLEPPHYPSMNFEYFSSLVEPFDQHFNPIIYSPDKLVKTMPVIDNNNNNNNAESTLNNDNNNNNLTNNGSSKESTDGGAAAVAPDDSAESINPYVYSKCLIRANSPKYKYFFHNVFTWLDTSIQVILPFVLMVICNINIIHKVLMTKNRTKGKNVKRLKKIKGMCIMIVSVSVIFFVLEAPILIFICLIQGRWVDESWPHMELAWTILNLMMYTNHVINFFSYCMTGTKFRRELIKLLYLHKLIGAWSPNLISSTKLNVRTTASPVQQMLLKSGLNLTKFKKFDVNANELKTTIPNQTQQQHQQQRHQINGCFTANNNNNNNNNNNKLNEKINMNGILKDQHRGNEAPADDDDNENVNVGFKRKKDNGFLRTVKYELGSHDVKGSTVLSRKGDNVDQTPSIRSSTAAAAANVNKNPDGSDVSSEGVTVFNPETTKMSTRFHDDSDISSIDANLDDYPK